MLMNNSSPEFSRKPLKINQDDNFSSKLVSKDENSAANPSFRVYYGNVSSSVPFTWEIQPGTPKHKFCDNSVPPLTPPPSYYFSTPNHDDQNKPQKRKYHPRSRFLYNLLLNINVIKKGHVASSSSPSSLSSSSWSSSTSTTLPSSSSSSSKGYTSSKRRRFTSFGSSFDDHSKSGSYTVVIMKKALLSFVCRRSG